MTCDLTAPFLSLPEVPGRVPTSCVVILQVLVEHLSGPGSLPGAGDTAGTKVDACLGGAYVLCV